jgi:hypothetical protein
MGKFAIIICCYFWEIFLPFGDFYLLGYFYPLGNFYAFRRFFFLWGISIPLFFIPLLF